MSKDLLTTALADIEKRFGKGTIMFFGDKPDKTVDVIPTGCLSVDHALGIGGFPKGRVIEIYGQESGGKTTCSLHAIANCQRMGGQAAFLDIECALDPNYAASLGVDLEKLLISQPSSAEEALEVVEALVRSNSVDIIIVDSVAALVPQAELNGNMGDSNMGGMARLMGQALRKLTSAISESNTCLIFLNQLRSKIGIVFGNPETTPGGNALKFYASIRMDIRRIAAIKDGERVIGNRTRIKVIKNKLAPPHKECEVSLMFGEGFAKEADILQLALDNGIFEQKGSWIAYNTYNLCQGKLKVVELLKEKPELYEEVKNLVKIKLEEISK